MANGIDSRYTGIGTVPIVQEAPKTSFTDFLQFVTDYRDKQDAKKLQRDSLDLQVQQTSDLKEYRENSLDIQSQELDNQKTHQAALRKIQQQNADTNSNKQLADAKFQKDTSFLNRIKLLPESERLRELLLYQAEEGNDDALKRLGTSKEDINERIAKIEDYKTDVTRASGFIKSKNPLQIKYWMDKLMDGDINSNEAARNIYSQLANQKHTADEHQKELFIVEPKEIAAAYTQYADNLKTIAGKYIPQMDLTNVNSDTLYQMMQSQKKFIPPEKMDAYNKEIDVLTKSYANKYRIEKGIGTYDTSDPNTPLSKIEMTPDDFTLTDERFQLIEKAQDEKNDLWEKWLNEEDYTFSDLEADYNAGTKGAQVDETDEKDQVGATGGGDEGFTPEQQKAIYAQGLKDNPFLTKEQTLEEFLPEEEPKQAGAFYDKDTNNWYILKDEKMVVASAGQIAEAKKLGQKAVTKDLTANEKRKIKTNLGYIKNLLNSPMKEGEKVRRIRKYQDKILAIDPTYNFTETQTIAGN